jgi:predicted outer membrane repeat protein
MKADDKLLARERRVPPLIAWGVELTQEEPMSKSNRHSFCLRVAIALAPGLAVAENGYADQILVPSQQPTIQAGINAAVNGDEVVLADGTYTGAGNFNCTYGGKLITVRSASGNPETCVINCGGVLGRRGFLFNSGETSAAVLSGVTIRDGDIGVAFSGGGAILMTAGATPTITHCRFVSNTSHFIGGAIVGEGALIDHCDFLDNDAATQGGAIAGGSLTIRGCRFLGNHVNAPPAVQQQGGAVRLTGTSSLIVDCLFNNNFSDVVGGAIFTDAVGAQIVNCLFNNNTSGEAGGAIFAAGGTQIVNCTFVLNIANLIAVATGGGAIFAWGGTTTVSNCIVLDNSPDQFLVDAGTLDVTFSNIDDGWPGLGNISDGALFTDQLGPDRLAGTIDDDLSLRGPSPCADSGNNAAVPAGILTDLAGNPRFADSPDAPDLGSGTPRLVDMGCYEFQPVAACPTDLNGSGSVNGFDLAILLGAWGVCPR